MKRKQCKQCSFHQLLERDGSVSIHKRNMRFLAIEIFKIKTGTNPTLVGEIFPLNEEMRYELRNRTDFAIRTVNSVRNRREWLRRLGPKHWEMLPLN